MKITDTVLELGDLLCDAIPAQRLHLQMVIDFFNNSNKPLYGCHENDVNSKCVIDPTQVTHEIRDIYFNDSATKLLCDVELLDTFNGRSIKSLIDRGLQVKLHLWTNLHKISSPKYSSLTVTGLGIQLVNVMTNSNTAKTKIREI